uniref:oligogalacturonate-specific porin KdgM family protein n=1 Tax=Klebsiella variicola TaxID=244366 RepID=UPI0031E04A60
CVEQDDKGWDARKRAYCLKIQPATGSFARNLIYSTKPQGTVYRHVNDDYKYKNDKSSATENALTLRYKWNDWFSPYIEYDYLGKQGYHDGQNKISESRYRIGMTFTL